jgi:DNA modification methylase
VTAPYYQDESVVLHHGDCLAVLRDLPDDSVDAVVTDPPYSLSFMSHGWDTHDTPAAFQQWCQQWAAECLRVMKPGAHLLAFGGTRTWHRLTCAIEDAGFQIRDSIAWLYGSGFPKSLDVSRAVDTHARFGGSSQKQQRQRDMGADYEPHPLAGTPGFGDGNLRKGADGNTQGRKADVISAEGQQWAGWGTALKPAFEPIVVARKPLAGTIAQNVLTHGTGALNVDGCRVESGPRPLLQNTGGKQEAPAGGFAGKTGSISLGTTTQGRWPPNVVLDGAAAELLDQQSGTLTSGANPTQRGSDKFRDAYGEFQGQEECVAHRGADSGGASRFFKVVQESPSDLAAGLQDPFTGSFVPWRYEAKAPASERPRVGDVAHSTVKPVGLISWLVRLVTPPGGTVLDMFAGSGTTGEACVVEGFRAILVEREAAYLPLIVARLSKPIQIDLFGGEAS